MFKQIFLYGLLISSVVGHSWLEKPVQRDSYDKIVVQGSPDSQAHGLTTQPNGCFFTRAEGESLTYSQGGSWSKAVVGRGRDLCLRHAANGHVLDDSRGWSRTSLSTGVNHPQDSQADFDSNVLATNVDYAAFQGFRVTIPSDTPLGTNTIQWAWDFCGGQFWFVSCADIEVVEFDDPAGMNFGLPAGQMVGNCEAGLPAIPVFSHDNDCRLVDLDGPVPSNAVNPFNGGCTNCDGGGDGGDGGDGGSTDSCDIALNLDFTNSGVVSSVSSNGCTNLDVHTCSATVNVNVDNPAHDSLGFDVSVSSSCHDDGGDDDDGQGCAGSNPNPPAGFCCTSADCQSYCKNYQAPHSNGYYACHGG
jgi:hypothetical protein